MHHYEGYCWPAWTPCWCSNHGPVSTTGHPLAAAGTSCTPPTGTSWAAGSPWRLLQCQTIKRFTICKFPFSGSYYKYSWSLGDDYKFNSFIFLQKQTLFWVYINDLRITCASTSCACGKMGRHLSGSYFPGTAHIAHDKKSSVPGYWCVFWSSLLFWTNKTSS